MSEIFNIGKINYEGAESRNPYAFKHYNKEEIVAGKKMGEHLKFAMSYWHTLCGDGTDMFGAGTADKSFGGKEPLEIYKKKVTAGFELMDKLGIDYFCFHDKDIAPEGNSLSEFQQNLDVIVPLIKENMAKYNKKLLWASSPAFCFFCCSLIICYDAKIVKALKLCLGHLRRFETSFGKAKNKV